MHTGEDSTYTKLVLATHRLCPDGEGRFVWTDESSWARVSPNLVMSRRIRACPERSVGGEAHRPQVDSLPAPRVGSVCRWECRLRRQVLRTWIHRFALDDENGDERRTREYSWVRVGLRSGLRNHDATRTPNLVMSRRSRDIPRRRRYPGMRFRRIPGFPRGMFHCVQHDKATYALPDTGNEEGV